ncbi:MAG: hypothetical protein U0528_14885 [Anaerolineae bacterium]
MTQANVARVSVHRRRWLYLLLSISILAALSPLPVLLFINSIDVIPDLSVTPEIRAAVLDSTVLLQVGIAGANRRDCVKDYDAAACSEAFHFGLGTILSDHLILTHDHFQVIGDDAGTLAEIQKYKWFKIRGRDGELIISTADLTIAPESVPVGMIVLSLPERYRLSQIGLPARVQHGLSNDDYLRRVVYYPRLGTAIDSIYPYDAAVLWQQISVGAAHIRGVQVLNEKALFAAQYGDEAEPLLNGDCGGGSFTLIDGAITLLGTQNYVTPTYYLVLAVGR